MTDATHDNADYVKRRAWPAPCAVCGKPVRKSESHAGAPGSPQPVRHLDCALKGAA